MGLKLLSLYLNEIIKQFIERFSFPSFIVNYYSILFISCQWIFLCNTISLFGVEFLHLVLNFFIVHMVEIFCLEYLSPEPPVNRAVALFS